MPKQVKVRATRTIIKEYFIDPELYPENSTVEEMINIDKEFSQDDPEMFFYEVVSDDIKFEIID